MSPTRHLLVFESGISNPRKNRAHPPPSIFFTLEHDLSGLACVDPVSISPQPTRQLSTVTVAAVTAKNTNSKKGGTHVIQISLDRRVNIESV
ncbi:hypothetical protein VTJ04DRAFT_4409 [Mycothermus thermophilus]|uniref:uncharacterized protein n=1 Tax=Humicola insolens TaxID=85995 RepID=UPI003743A707